MKKNDGKGSTELLAVQGNGGYGMDVQPLCGSFYIFLIAWVARDLDLEGFEVWGPCWDRIWRAKIEQSWDVLVDWLATKSPS